MQGNVAGTLQVVVAVVGAGRSRHGLEQGCSSYGDGDAGFAVLCGDKFWIFEWDEEESGVAYRLRRDKLNE